MTRAARTIAILREHVPPAPPCFDSAYIWASYVIDASMEKSSDDAAKPLSLNGLEVVVNHDWSFCADCLPAHATQMQRLGRCNPRHLRDLQEVPA